MPGKGREALDPGGALSHVSAQCAILDTHPPLCKLLTTAVQCPTKGYKWSLNLVGMHAHAAIRKYFKRDLHLFTVSVLKYRRIYAELFSKTTPVRCRYSDNGVPVRMQMGLLATFN